MSCAVFFASLTGIATAAPIGAATPLVRGVVSDAVRAGLPHDVPGALATSSDQGVIGAGAVLPHVRLELARSPQMQAAFDQLTHDQYTRGTAAYHRWLTPAGLRAYGPAQQDIVKVAAWLTSHGLTVNSVSPSGMSIDFGGRAGSIAAAFGTQLHLVARGGEAHIANISVPTIPAALAPVVTGVTLANFFPKPTVHKLPPAYTDKTTLGTFYAVTPPDFATIYSLNPLLSGNSFYGKITGAGVTLAVVEQTPILSSDWLTFRKTFGLAGYKGTLTQISPGGCAPAQFIGDEGEAALDAEWSSAAAPDAHIIEASCLATPTVFGVETALQNLVEKPTPATILSISYGGPELANGFAFVEGWNNLLEEGASEGKAIFVSSGDSGASADEGTLDVDGLGVNGLADSAYNVSVGGTDFYDTALGQNAAYWTSTNTSYYGSARSYVPEVPWNNSCASSIIVAFLKYSGPQALCNGNPPASASPPFIQNDIGGTGGQSVYIKKPDWQSTSILGVPNDGVRDEPDVSLFASNGAWNHFYLLCMSDAREGGVPCNYHNLNDLLGSAAGGTSFAAPAFAGIAALLQQSLAVGFGQSGLLLGNPAPEFYQIAKAQLGLPLLVSGCNATLGKNISTACVFNDVTAGDIAEPCKVGTVSCVGSAASTKGIGVLAATVGHKAEYAFPATPGYDLATGLGTVNVSNLIYNYIQSYTP